MQVHTGRDSKEDTVETPTRSYEDRLINPYTMVAAWGAARIAGNNLSPDPPDRSGPAWTTTTTAPPNDQAPQEHSRQRGGRVQAQ